MIALTFVLCACATSGSSTQTQTTAQSDYVLGIGDVIKVTVFGHTDLSGEFTVEPNGTISYPLIQTIPAAGYTTNDLQTALTQKLHPNYLVDPKVSVEILSYRNMYILGEVQQPGKYEYAPNMTVLQAVAIAGGYTYRADEGGADVTRHVKSGLNTFTVDEKAMLKPGDTIVIKRRWF